MKRVILGIDEVGRGPYAGPLVIGACILPEDRENNPWISELNDSKKLSAKKREELNKIIREKAPACATGWVTASEIDELGISEALKLATRRAIKEIQSKNVAFTEIIIDGISNFLAGTALEKYVTTMKKADFLVKEVSAASIIAKVERDNYMVELAKKYPGYGFEKHVGYGTAAHQKAMEELGITPEHRKSFAPVAKILAQGKVAPAASATPASVPTAVTSAETTTKKGTKGEQKITEYLLANRHDIILKNYKTKFYEIDIISKKDDKYYFTEVKYRKSKDVAAEAIDQKKLQKMRLGADDFMRTKSQEYTLAVGIVEGENYDFKEWYELNE